jgi:hypothetical protein
MNPLEQLDKHRETRIQQILDDVPGDVIAADGHLRHLAERVFDLERLIFQINGDTIEVGLNLACFVTREEWKEHRE